MTKMPLMGPAHNKYISPGVVCEPQSSFDGSYEFSSNLWARRPSQLAKVPEMD